MSLGRKNGSNPLPPNRTLDQVHTTMKSLNPAIKSASEARVFLSTKGWELAGEVTSHEILARTLFAVVAENGKLPAQVANTILAVAYLITENIENGLKLNLSNIITKHLLDSIIPITTDIQTRLDNHLQAVSQLTKSHSEMSDKLQHTQEQLNETSEKVNSNAKTYSQVAATLPNPSPPHPHPLNANPTYSQIQIRNREEIKQRQVLINFSNSPDLNLDILDEDTLSRKALDSLNTTWAASPDPKPEHPKLRSATLLRNGGLLLELDSAEVAEWLKGTSPSELFLSNLGSGANIKNRSYQVIVQFVPTSFNPSDAEHL